MRLTVRLMTESEIRSTEQVADIHFAPIGVKFQHTKNTRIIVIAVTEMRTKMEALEQKMRNQMSKVAADLGLQENKTIKFESNSQFGHFLRVNLKVSVDPVRVKITSYLFRVQF